MPLGDFFLPEPELICPLCARPLPQWEGFGGPGVFAVFAQGQVDAVERRLASQVAEGPIRLSDGRLPLFATCKGQHSSMAEAVVEGGVWVGTELLDVEAGEGLPLVGGWVLWRASAGRYAVSTRSPTAAQGIVPASITAIGYNELCVLATRRTDTRDPKAQDEWYVIDVAAAQAVGPVPDSDLRSLLTERGLPEPAVMRLPEDVAYGSGSD